MQALPSKEGVVVALPNAVPVQSESFLLKALISGCVSAVVSASLNPFDVTKIRMQNQSASNRMYTGLIPGMMRIYREEGMGGLAKGMRPSMYRELSYSSIRIGAYEPLRKFLSVTFTDNREGKNTETSPVIKYFAALMSGGGGSALCNPFDLAKTAFQAQLPTAPGVQSALKYNTPFAFFRYTYSQHGVAGLYKGWFVTSARAGVLTSAQIGSYDTIKNNICKKYLGLEEGFAMHFGVSMLVGLITTTATNPFDVIKTRYLADVGGNYKSVPDCVIQLFRSEGVRGFFKGWTPAYWRIGPHTVSTLLLIEKVRMLLGLSTL